MDFQLGTASKASSYVPLPCFAWRPPEILASGALQRAVADELHREAGVKKAIDSALKMAGSTASYPDTEQAEARGAL